MICPTCTAESMRWLDTTPQGLCPGLGFVTLAGAAYDLTPRGIADRRRGRYERWRRIVRDQMQAIADQCRAQGHTAVPEVRPPRVVQIDLLDLLDAA